MTRAPGLAPLLGLSLLLAAACDRGSKAPDPTQGEGTSGPPRTLVVPKDHPYYGRFEAPEAQNACASDGQCVKGGCSGEVCAAESLMGTCDVPPVQLPASAACGCFAGECVWTSSDGATLPASPPATDPGPGPAPSDELCGDRRCAAGESCIEYFGIAGPRGPKFKTCAVPCKRGAKNDGCPEGTRCVVIADGPGDVCQ